MATHELAAKQSRGMDKSPSELAKMPLVARSRYLAYQPAAAGAEKGRQEALQRVRGKQKQRDMEKRSSAHYATPIYASAKGQEDLHNSMMGEIRAAERRERHKAEIKSLKSKQAWDVQSVLEQQPLASQAIKYNRWLSSQLVKMPTMDSLDGRQRRRCEELLADDSGSTVRRELTSLEKPR